MDVTQHGLPNDEVCHDASDSESASKNGQVQLRAHAHSMCVSSLATRRTAACLRFSHPSRTGGVSLVQESRWRATIGRAMRTFQRPHFRARISRPPGPLYPSLPQWYRRRSLPWFALGQALRTQIGIAPTMGTACFFFRRRSTPSSKLAPAARRPRPLKRQL
jgi:hypothetical protein